jgi:hypothetical protein
MEDLRHTHEFEESRFNSFSGPDRRSVSLDKVSLMIEESAADTTSKLMQHMDVKFGQIHKLFADHIDGAFPPGPLHKHKEHHQGLIESAESMKKLRQDLIGWTVKGGLGILFMLVGMGALEWIKRELTK